MAVSQFELFGHSLPTTPYFSSETKLFATFFLIHLKDIPENPQTTSQRYQSHSRLDHPLFIQIVAPQSSNVPIQDFEHDYRHASSHEIHHEGPVFFAYYCKP